MKKLVLLAIVAAFMFTGCSQFSATTPNAQIDTENGNKIYAYQDIEPKEKTTIIIVRVEGENSVKEMTKMMGDIETIFTQADNGEE